MPASDRKVALITGGGTGVGRAAALQFARRNFDLVINYSRSEKEAEQTAGDVRERGARAITVACDVARDDQVREMAGQCRSVFGRLDVLVNNAARTHFVAHSNLEQMTEPMWDEILGVNLKGAFFVTRAVLPLMQESGGGSIVNVGSVAGVAGVGSSVAYAASKGGLITMTRTLARALAPQVRVNCVCPGAIQSRWLEDHQEMIEASVKRTPLQKICTTDDVADVILFLACDAGMMTGQSLIVDGGIFMGSG